MEHNLYNTTSVIFDQKPARVGYKRLSTRRLQKLPRASVTKASESKKAGNARATRDQAMDAQTISNEIGSTLMQLYALLDGIADGKLSWTVKDMEYRLVWTQGGMETREVGRVWPDTNVVKISLSYLGPRIEAVSVWLVEGVYTESVARVVLQCVGSHLSAVSKRLKGQYPADECIERPHFAVELQFTFALDVRDLVTRLSRGALRLEVSQELRWEEKLNPGQDLSYRCYSFSIYADTTFLKVCKLGIKVQTFSRYDCHVSFKETFGAKSGGMAVHVCGNPEQLLHVLAPVVFDWSRNLMRFAEQVHAQKIKKLVDGFLAQDQCSGLHQSQVDLRVERGPQSNVKVQ